MRVLTLENKIAQTLEQGLELNQTPTGRTLGIDGIRGSSLFRITYQDGKQGTLPDKYAGRYTNAGLALTALQSFIRETWEVAEEHTKTKKTKVA